MLWGLSGVNADSLCLSYEKGQGQRGFGIYNGLETVGQLIAAFVYSTFIQDDFGL